MSGASSRRKGNAAEVAVVKALRRSGFAAETSRNVLGGTRTGDDIVTQLPVSIEVKDRVDTDLSGWLRQAEGNAAGRVALVWHKKRGVADPEGWYVTMSGASLLRLLQEAYKQEF